MTSLDEYIAENQPEIPWTSRVFRLSCGNQLPITVPHKGLYSLVKWDSNIYVDVDYDSTFTVKETLGSPLEIGQEYFAVFLRGEDFPKVFKK